MLDGNASGAGALRRSRRMRRASYCLRPLGVLPRAWRLPWVRLVWRLSGRRRVQEVCDWLAKLGWPDLACAFGEWAISSQVIQFGATAARAGQRVAAPSSEDLRDALARSVAALHAAGVRPFICFGTLLGYTRERAFIDGDRDIDLGIFHDETDCGTAHQALLSAGLEIELYESDPWPCRIKARIPESGVSIDIVFFRREGRHLLTYARVFAHVLLRYRTPFGLAPAEFAGVKVLIPDPPELFLDENYGDWRVRADFHHYILTSPLTDFADPMVRYVLTRQLAAALRDGNAVHCRALRRLGRRHYPADPFWAAEENP